MNVIPLALTLEHKKLLSIWVNDWWWKEGVISYSEKELQSKMFHNSLDDNLHGEEEPVYYSQDEQEQLNWMREKWINYEKLKGTENDPRPEHMRM